MNDDNITLKALKKLVYEFREKRDWTGEDPKDMALSLVLEAAELLEHFQFKTGEEVEAEAKLRGAICDELADVLWWVMAMADRLGIDMAQAVERKKAKNEEKYPVELFGKNVPQDEKRRAYYRIKAQTRGGHPLAEEEK